MAREMNVSEPTMRRIVETEFKLSPLKLQTSLHLTDLKKKIDLSEDSSQQIERWYGQSCSHLL